MDNQMIAYIVIRRPLVTEKSTMLATVNKYIFEVDVRANKPQIKAAVEKAFDVSVTGVNVMVMKGKPKVRRTQGGKRESYASDWKKAVVTLAPGDKIELFEGV